MSIGDSEIIAGTEIRPKGKAFEAVFVLPDGEEVVANAESPEAVRKSIIQWCDVVRQRVKDKEGPNLEEQQAKRDRKRQGIDTAIYAPTQHQKDVMVPTGSPMGTLIGEYNRAKEQIQALTMLITTSKASLAEYELIVKALEPLVHPQGKS